MASASSTSKLSLTSSTGLVDAKTARQSAAAAPQCVTIPTLPPPPIQSQTRANWKTTAYYRKMARNVMAMATGDVTTTEVAQVELPEFVKTLQETWDKVEDKYAVSTLAVTVIVGLWGSAGLISAIDRLPLVPGVLEVVGIGYSGWFAYKNLFYKPDREAFVRKLKGIYNDILGTS